MTIILFLFVIVVLLFVVASGASRTAAIAKRRYIEEHPDKYYRDVAVMRMSWAIATGVVGFACPAIWILRLILALIGFYYFDKSNKLKESHQDVEKQLVTCYVAPRDIPRSNTFNAARQ